MSLDDVLRDPSISRSLRAALTEFHAQHGYLPPRRKWFIIFGMDREAVANRWMLL